MAVLLPHEVLAVIAEVSDHAVLFQNEGLDATNRAKHAQIYEALQSPFCIPLPLGRWGTILVGPQEVSRPVVSVLSRPPKKGIQRHQDLPHIDASPLCTEVNPGRSDEDLCLEPQALAVGRFPTARADGSEWLPQESWRRQRGGDSRGIGGDERRLETTCPVLLHPKLDESPCQANLLAVPCQQGRMKG